MRILLVFPIFILLSVCNPTGGKSAHPGRRDIVILNKTFITSIGIYFLDKDSVTIAKFNAQAKDIIPEFKVSGSLPDTITGNSYSIKYIKNPSLDFTPPDTSALSYFGRSLTIEEKSGVQNSAGALSIQFGGTKENVAVKQQKISELISAVSEEKNVVIMDYNTFECFNPASWKEKRVKNFQDEHKDITGQITIHLYREGEFCRGITMGMDKFCLPDVSIKGISCRDQTSFGNLLNAVVQTLFENQVIRGDSTLTIDLLQIKNNSIRVHLTSDIKNNATKVVAVKLKSVEPEEGDNINTQYMLEFKNPKYSSPQEEQTALLENLFGVEESIVHTNHDDELLAASEKAKLRLPELRELFNEGLQPGYSLLVKLPFKTDGGGREWMWVEITKWKSESISGILQNDPSEIAKLKAGAIVKGQQKDVFDYILYKPDGTYEGNETGKILEHRK